MPNAIRRATPVRSQLRCHRRLAIIGASGIALLVPGCGRFARASAEPPARVVFVNESLDQATVYVVTPGSEFRRIGTVIPGRADTLKVPADMVIRAGTLNIVARLLARSGMAQTGEVSMRPGEVYQVRLTPDGRSLSFLPDS